MKKALVTKLALAGTLGVAAVMLSSNADAAACGACHTMHNSQDGQSMRFDTQDTPLAILLRGDCIYCHTGLNTAGDIANVNIAPKVIGNGDPTASGTLAGGDFWYVANQSQQYGHDVVGVSGVDTTTGGASGLNPPGGLALATQLECAGTLGCHGDSSIASREGSMLGAHHAAHNNINDGTSVLDGTTVGTSYRFLLGVLGREDSDWQFAETPAVHNMYYGINRTGDVTGAVDDTTISGLCARCHSSFHNAVTGRGEDDYGISTDNTNVTGAGVDWTRHPTDYDMPLAGEYSTAFAGGYDVQTPVGTSDLSDATTDPTQALDRIVLCVSCHRAHGSPYNDALRWSYSTMLVGSATDGCINCHTAK
jgi:predicted CXXCH cytochrome family protein